MKILWVKVGGLWPVNTGGRLRSLATLKELSRRHRITLMTTHGKGDDVRGLEASLPGCEVVSFPHVLAKRGSREFAGALAASWLTKLPVDLWRCRVPALQREVRRRLSAGAADVCVADFLAATPNVPLGGEVPVVLFEHNVEHQIWRRLHQTESSVVRRLLLGVEWRKLRRYEAAVVTQAHRTLTVSERDRELLGRCAPSAVVRAVPTGVDLDYFAPDGTAERPGAIVFTGSMDWYPNEQGVIWFIESALPLVRTRVPNASATIVGRAPSQRLRDCAERHRVSVTGTVADVRPFLRQAQVVVVPLRVGGGTRLKIFEALAAAKAVVSTRVGAEGLPVMHGEHLLLADEPADFAACTVELLRDAERRRALGDRGRALVAARFSWVQAARQFELECKEAAHAG